MKSGQQVKIVSRGSLTVYRIESNDHRHSGFSELPNGSKVVFKGLDRDEVILNRGNSWFSVDQESFSEHAVEV